MTRKEPPQPLTLTVLRKLTKGNAGGRESVPADRAAHETKHEDDVEDLWTVKEVARKSRVHPKTVHKWIDCGELEAIRKGRLIRISKRAFGKFFKGK